MHQLAAKHQDVRKENRGAQFALALMAAAETVANFTNADATSAGGEHVEENLESSAVDAASHL
jgi:hypothetical protein